MGSLPKRGAIEEYDEIGILKLVKDSISPIIISIKINKDKRLKILLRLAILEENDIMLIVSVKPQKM